MDKNNCQQLIERKNEIADCMADFNFSCSEIKSMLLSVSNNSEDKERLCNIQYCRVLK